MENLTYLGFGHVGMFINDMVESKKFYMAILGFEVVSEYVTEEKMWMCFLNNGNCTIELIESPDPENKKRKDGVVDHLSIRVSDIESAKSYLEAKGVTFETDILFDGKLYEKGERFAMFRGPSGERLQLEEIQ